MSLSTMPAHTESQDHVGGAGGEGLLWGVRWQWTGFTAVRHIPVSLHWVFRSSLDVMSAGGVCLKDRVLAGCRSERAC